MGMGEGFAPPDTRCRLWVPVQRQSRAGIRPRGQGRLVWGVMGGCRASGMGACAHGSPVPAGKGG